MSSVRLWFGEWGEYIVPEYFKGLRYTKRSDRGWPDMRQQRARELLLWVRFVDVPDLFTTVENETPVSKRDANTREDSKHGTPN